MRIDDTVLKNYEQRGIHHLEVKNILVQNGCLDNKDQLRRWTKKACKQLQDKGHTSLDFDKCKCKTTNK